MFVIIRALADQSALRKMMFVPSVVRARSVTLSVSLQWLWSNSSNAILVIVLESTAEIHWRYLWALIFCSAIPAYSLLYCYFTVPWLILFIGQYLFYLHLWTALFFTAPINFGKSAWIGLSSLRLNFAAVTRFFPWKPEPYHWIPILFRVHILIFWGPLNFLTLLSGKLEFRQSDILEKSTLHTRLSREHQHQHKQKYNNLESSPQTWLAIQRSATIITAITTFIWQVRHCYFSSQPPRPKVSQTGGPSPSIAWRSKVNCTCPSSQAPFSVFGTNFWKDPPSRW